MTYTWTEAKSPSETCIKNEESQSQLNQDMWALEQCSCKKNGYYIDIGSADGQNISNTAVMDNKFGWKGLCVDIQPKNMENRTCSVEKSVLYDKSGEIVKFKKTESDELSGITTHLKAWPDATKKGEEVSYETKSAQDIFNKHNVPRHVDFLDMDVEGAELKILQGMVKDGTFSKHCFANITIEHNWVEPERSDIRSLLEKQGYKYAGSEKFDDRYIGPC